VRIYLPQQPEPLLGRVSLIQRTPLAEIRSGLSDALPPETARELATVLIRALEPLPTASAGLPAEVEFDLRPRGVVGDVLRAVYP
jgi:hypothetical protein